MAELLSFSEERDGSTIIRLQPDTTPAPAEGNVTFVNFRPEENRRKALKAIGEITMSMTVVDTKADGSTREITADYEEILSSEPMRMEEDEHGNIDVWFLQYWREYRGDTLGTPHSGYARPHDNGRSLETLRILTIHRSACDESIEGTYIHPRIHKHMLLDYWSRQRSERGRKEIEAIRRAMWEPDEQ